MPLAPGVLKAAAIVWAVADAPATTTNDAHTVLIVSIVGGALTSVTAIAVAVIQRGRRDSGAAVVPLSVYEERVAELQSELEAEKAKHRRTR